MKKKKKSQKWKAVSVLLPMIIAMVAMVMVHSKNATKTHRSAPIMWTHDPTEKYIIGKALDKPLKPELIPVVIYEVQDETQRFAASGLCYFNPDVGSYRLLTMAHIFFRRDRPTSFIVRTLTPCGGVPSWCIVRVAKTGKQWAMSMDLAECDIKPLAFPLPVVTCEVDIDPDRIADTQAYTFDQIRTGKLANQSRKEITSLASGERATLCGIVTEPDPQYNTSWYYLADYTSIKGESGTPFIDDQGGVYFVQGGLSESMTNLNSKKVFKLTVDKPSCILGPLRLKTR